MARIAILVEKIYEDLELQYPRLRLGIDSPPPPAAGKDYVLGRFTPDQRKQIDPAVDRACSAIVTWIEKGITTAMNEFNADT